MKQLFFLLFIIALLPAFSQEDKNNLTSDEMKSEIIDYSNIKSVLNNDRLQESKKLKEKVIKQIKKERKILTTKKYFYPDEPAFWTYISQLWLVKNAQLLKWDTPRPDYGIADVVQQLLQKFGYYNKKFKILVIDNPSLYHFALPMEKDTHLFVISLPFMRSLDLTKVDIALLFLEDMFRDEARIFLNKIKAKKDFFGTNFSNNKYDPQYVKDVLTEYTRIIFKTGFSFQEQFDITKKMDSVLKSDPKIWNIYYKMLMKLDALVKDNLLFKNYNKVYPSPEMQIQWLKPKQTK